MCNLCFRLKSDISVSIQNTMIINKNYHEEFEGMVANGQLNSFVGQNKIYPKQLTWNNHDITIFPSIFKSMTWSKCNLIKLCCLIPMSAWNTNLFAEMEDKIEENYRHSRQFWAGWSTWKAVWFHDYIGSPLSRVI